MTEFDKIFSTPTGIATNTEVVARALGEQPALYVNHLLIAAHLEKWADVVDDHTGSGQIFGFVDALRDVAAHLRQADYLPGGAEWDELKPSPKKVDGNQ